MNPKTILLVDDETHILNVVSIKLRNAGYEVITAEDGLEGFEQAREHLPDLIITDYQMPLLSGVELCARLQGEPTTRHIPAIILTARGFSISVEERETRNIVEVIDKPFSPRQVLASVQELLDPQPAVSGVSS